MANEILNALTASLRYDGFNDVINGQQGIVSVAKSFPGVYAVTLQDPIADTDAVISATVQDSASQGRGLVVGTNPLDAAQLLVFGFDTNLNVTDVSLTLNVWQTPVRG
jgi:hypothetical protein